ncbi:MAG: TolC family protein, partial [Flavobacteriales bacterium]|nr:TolC family protein [Flavobacteriales bacterium]
WAEENLSLSQKVYDKTLVKFKEGLAGSFEVSENQRRIISAQGAYINSAMQLLQARTKLQRALNQI